MRGVVMGREGGGERCSDGEGRRWVRGVVMRGREGGKGLDEKCSDEGEGGGLVRDVVVDSGCEFAS